MKASTMFLGDDDSCVDRLIKACERVVSTAPLKERDFQPYFDAASEEEAAQAVQQQLAATRRSGGQKTIRSGSPGSDTQAPSSKGSRPVKAAKLAPAPPATPAVKSRPQLMCLTNLKAPSTPAATTKARPVRSMTQVSLAAIKAACPAMFTSPKPTDLPMPSALLRRRSSDGLSSPRAFAPLALVMVCA